MSALGELYFYLLTICNLFYSSMWIDQKTVVLYLHMS